MKKVYLLAAIALTLTASSCSKKNDTDCYECDKEMNGVYNDAGCYTREEWRGLNFSVNNGNDVLDKSRYCRKK